MTKHRLHAAAAIRRFVPAALILAATATPAFGLALDVRVTNTPLPVTGTVNANINGTLPVTGTVQLGGTPAVEAALPTHPFFSRLVMNSGGPSTATGTSSGTLAVTTLSFTNFGSTAQTLFVFNPVLNGAGCSSTVIGGSDPSLYMLLPPGQTTQLQFPTPLVIPISSGSSCLGFSRTTTGGTVEVYVNGFTR